MSLENKYELLYREQDGVCGEPFSEFVDFAESHSKPTASVLDLGCGQGRDVFVFARAGMSVTGVDISRTGIEQMLAFAGGNDLEVCGVISDLRDFETNARFDIIILDRTLHMLSNPNERIGIVERCADWLVDDGHILIADEPSNIAAFAAWFDSDSREWQSTPNMKRGFCFAQKMVSRA